MAKMFYSLDEVQEKLGRTREEIDQLVEDGLLRKFYDGTKLMFKASDVDNLDASVLGSSNDQDGGVIPLADLSNESGEIGLAPMDSGDAISMTGDDTAGDIDLAAGDIDLAGDSGEIGLAPTDTGSQIGLVPSDTGDQIGVDGGDDGKDDTVITNYGVDVLGDEQQGEEPIDPLAQTQIAPDLADQIELDSGSSGSGLLDLSREADDTSLGAELLEEIYPGSDEGPAEGAANQLDLAAASAPTASTAAASATATGVGTEALAPSPQVKYVAAMDPRSGVFGATLLVPMLALIFMGIAAAAAVTGVHPGMVEVVADKILIFLGAAAGATLIVFAVGMVVTGQSGKPKAAKQPKTAKQAKAKAKKEKPTKKAKKEKKKKK